MAGMSFGQAQEQRLRLATDKLDTAQAQEWQKINDDYQIGMINALKTNGAGGGKKENPSAIPAKTPTFSNLSVTGGGPAIPASMAPAAPGPLPLNEGMPGSGTMGRTMFSTDAAGGVTVPDRAGYQTVLDETPGLKEGGIIERIKEGLGLVRPAKPGEVVGDQAKDANRVANQTGGMIGGAAKALQSRQMRIEEELKRQGLRAGTEYVTDPTGNGSPVEDTVDAKLAEGEAVLNAGAAKIVGREGIAALNERGLKEMGMEGAQPEFKDGAVHAFGGVDFNDPEMVRKAQNMEIRRRMAAGVRQPVANPSLVQSAPIQATPVQPAPAAAPQKIPTYSVTEMGDPYTKEELVRNAERAKVAQAAQAQAASRAVAAPAANIANPSIASKAMSAGGKLLRAAASAPAAGIMAMMQSGEAGSAADDLDFAPGGRFRAAPAAAAGVMQPEKATGESMTPGDAMRLRRPAEPQYSQQVPVPAGYVAPKPQVFAARGLTKEDRSNYDLAEQGFGGVVRKAGNVYTDAGANPYLNQQFKEHDGMTGQQLLDQRIATDATRQAEAVAKEDKAQLDALEKADPRVRIARIEKEGTAAEKKAAQDAAVNLAREQNPKLTKAQEMAIRYGVKDAAKSDGYKIEMGEVAQALGIPAVDEEGKPISDVMTGRQVVNRNVDAERKFFAWMQKEGITDTNKGLALYMSMNGGSAAPASFASAAEVQAAAAAGQIKPGDKVIVNGRQATWQ